MLVKYSDSRSEGRCITILNPLSCSLTPPLFLAGLSPARPCRNPLQLQSWALLKRLYLTLATCPLNPPPPSPWLAVVFDHFCAGRTLTPHKGDARIMWCAYGKAPTRQFHGNPIAVSGSDHTRKNCQSIDAAIHMRENPSQTRFLEGCSSSFMRLAQHLTFRFALGASNAFLVGENPTCSVPALWGCEGPWSYDYGQA